MEETPVTNLIPVGDVVKNVTDSLLENMRRLKGVGLHYLFMKETFQTKSEVSGGGAYVQIEELKFSF